MSRHVNPFEDDPPAGDAPPPPEDDWLPAPSVRKRTSQKTPPWVGPVFVVGLSLMAAPMILGWQGMNHWPRIGAMLLVAGVGLIAGIVFRRRRRGLLAGAAVVAGVAGAVACWLFAPTLGGLNRWTAGERLTAIQSLSPGAVECYQYAADDRAEVVAQFPTLAPAVRQAEAAWCTRTVEEAAERATGLQENDPATAAAFLRAVAERLRPLERPEAASQTLAAARQDAVRRWLARLDQEVKAVREKDGATPAARRALEVLPPLEKEARELGLGNYLDTHLSEARRTDLLARLDDARREVARLLEQDRYADAADAADRFAKKVEADARRAGLTDEVARFRQAAQVFGELADPSPGPRKDPDK